jgi:hypothetical protein
LTTDQIRKILVFLSLGTMPIDLVDTKVGADRKFVQLDYWMICRISEQDPHWAPYDRPIDPEPRDISSITSVCSR